MSWTKQEILSFWKEHPVISIAVNNEPYPVSSILLTYITDDYDFYFVTGPESYKTLALQKDPRLSFSLWEMNNVIIQGTANVEIISDKESQEEWIDKIVGVASGIENLWPPLLNMWKNDYVVIKATPTHMRAIDLSNQSMKQIEGKVFEVPFE